MSDGEMALIRTKGCSNSAEHSDAGTVGGIGFLARKEQTGQSIADDTTGASGVEESLSSDARSGVPREWQS